MTVEQMHYEVQLRLDRVDSESYPNLEIPELDVQLNRAQEILVRTLAAGNKAMASEKDQAAIDALRKIVMPDVQLELDDYDEDSVIAFLPEDYFYHWGTRVKITKENCPNRTTRAYIGQHDDIHRGSALFDSDYAWGEVVALFFDDKLRLFQTDFTIDSAYMTYLRRPAYIHWAEAYGGYALPDGTLLSGKQDCELADSIHQTLVDMTVALVTGDLESNFQSSLTKLKLNYYE